MNAAGFTSPNIIALPNAKQTAIIISFFCAYYFLSFSSRINGISFPKCEMSLQACKELPQQLQGRRVGWVEFDMEEEFGGSEKKAIEKEFESVGGFGGCCSVKWGEISVPFYLMRQNRTTKQLALLALA